MGDFLEWWESIRSSRMIYICPGEHKLKVNSHCNPFASCPPPLSRLFSCSSPVISLYNLCIPTSITHLSWQTGMNIHARDHCTSAIQTCGQDNKGRMSKSGHIRLPEALPRWYTGHVYGSLGHRIPTQLRHKLKLQGWHFPAIGKVKVEREDESTKTALLGAQPMDLLLPTSLSSVHP